jgi:putative endonuclease
MAVNNETGRMGELEARAYLERKGYKILAVNWRFRHCELDIIATNDAALVVVEVKTRSEKYLVAPEDSITHRKISRIVAAADAYARMHNISLPVRFDVICLIKKGASTVVKNHLVDAFYAPVSPSPSAAYESF